MKKIILIVSLSLTLTITVFSQDTAIVKYFPLKVGNVWMYYFQNSYKGGSDAGYNKYRITGTTLINGKTYFQFQRITTFIYGGSYSCQSYIHEIDTPLRVDSITGNLYSTANCPPAQLLDSLKSRLYDYANSCNFTRNCTDTANFTIFGYTFPSKQFMNYQGGQGAYRRDRYVKNIGIVYSLYSYPIGSCYATLRGCLLDGVLYGDTNVIVGLHQINSEIPKSFSLSQNFPNPFNPTTKIKFTVQSVEQIFLSVYDNLGREITALVNEQIQPGTYETDWDASNYPSGVYYYKLTAGDFSETRKMVLMK